MPWSRTAISKQDLLGPASEDQQGLPDQRHSKRIPQLILSKDAGKSRRITAQAACTAASKPEPQFYENSRWNGSPDTPHSVANPKQCTELPEMRGMTCAPKHLWLTKQEETPDRFPLTPISSIFNFCFLLPHPESSWESPELNTNQFYLRPPTQASGH